MINLGTLLLAVLILFITDMSLIWTRSKLAKKVNYDCDKCKVWDCPNHECRKKK